MTLRYQTKNLYAAAAIHAAGADYQGMTVDEDKNAWFIFEDPKGTLQEQERLYHRNRMKPIGPKTYVESMFLLRDDLRAALRA